MDVLSHLLNTFRLESRVFHNGQYCGEWQIDTSGSKKATFHVVTHGSCELLLNDGSTHEESLESGDLVIFPRDREHRIASSPVVAREVNSVPSISFREGLEPSGTGLVCGYIEFEHSRNQFLLDMLSDYVVIRSNELPWVNHVRPIVDVLISESLLSNPGVQATLNRLAELFFMVVLREFLQNSGQTNGFVSAFQDARIIKVLEAVYDEPEKNWNVESMAQIASMSRSAFAARFKELLGESPLQHLKRWRMQNAYRWFRDDHITVADAADRCGYDSEAAFSKAFKRETGLSPGRVRKT